MNKTIYDLESILKVRENIDNNLSNLINEDEIPFNVTNQIFKEVNKYYKRLIRYPGNLNLFKELILNKNKEYNLSNDLDLIQESLNFSLGGRIELEDYLSSKIKVDLSSKDLIKFLQYKLQKLPKNLIGTSNTQRIVEIEIEEGFSMLPNKYDIGIPIIYNKYNL
jgi:hypothetical protein